MIQHIVEQTYDTLPLQKSADHTVTVILDPQYGIDDIIHSKLRAVGDPLMRMHEDALRILRALRFVNQLNQHPNVAIDFEKSTRKALQKSFPLVTTMPKERLHQELMKVFGGNNPYGYIALIDELYLLNTLFPALARCKHIDQPIRYHPFDVYAHTLLVLHAAQQRNTNPYLKLAALYHDVGKVDQYAYYSLGIDGDEKSLPAAIMVQHPELGVTLAQQDFKKL
jgi:tRNA nucleotidyltransferase (CCA-adding enzyme)